MAKNPFILKKYFFPTISLIANSSHKPKEETETQFEIAANAFKLSKNKSDYQLTLNIGVVEDASKNPPYNGMVQVVGFFTSTEKHSQDESFSMVHKKGTGILYSAARELVLLVSSRGPWGPITLPVLDDLSDIKIEDLGEIEV